MRKKSAYLIGIKGVAMTSLAVYLKEKSYFVTGSDVASEFPTDIVLKKHKIMVKKGFNPENINKKFDLVVVTGAHQGLTNVEAIKAKSLGLSTYSHGEILGRIMKGKQVISVAGCHGKTTTSSLLSYLLTKAGFDPSYCVGTAYINGLSEGGHFGRGKYFIAEADEYMTDPTTNPKPRFLWQDPNLIVLTNIDYDHPDAFADIEEVKNAYAAFVSKLPSDGVLIACLDDQNVQSLLPTTPKNLITYGFSQEADYHIESYYFGDMISFMRVNQGEISLSEFAVRIPGKHNLLNALASCIAANIVGIEWSKIKSILKNFTGTKRRFEKIGEFGSVLLFDDYAHHPAEIIATISAARSWYPDKRLVVIFQPHTYSRTKALFGQFSRAFSGADRVFITDIYPSARESFDPTVSSNQLTIAANMYKKNTFYFKSKQEILTKLQDRLEGDELIITMGAGDIYTWHKDIIKLLKN